MSERYTWPVCPQAIEDDADAQHSGWIVNDVGYYDVFTDMGAYPLPNELLWELIKEGYSDGVLFRKPQVIYDRFRDSIYPLVLGAGLDLIEPSVYYSSSGSEAVEAAMKLARKATGRSRILAIRGDFHGKGYGSLSLSKWEPTYHFDGFGPMLPMVDVVEIDDRPSSIYYGDIAAIVISPINGNNTLELWPDNVWDIVRFVSAAGGLIIFDEVQTGIGRAGGIVSVTQADTGWRPPLDADIYCFGKGAGAGLPLAVTISEASLAKSVMTSGTHFNTMAGSPMACYLGTRMLRMLSSGLLDEMIDRARGWEARYNAISEEIIFRRYGYMMAIDVPEPKRFAKIGMRNGLLMVTSRDDKPLRFSPHYVLSDRDERAITVLLDQTFDEYWEGLGS